eukprot:12425450-Karenia_brevis.AAC.1
MPLWRLQQLKKLAVALCTSGCRAFDAPPDKNYLSCTGTTREVRRCALVPPASRETNCLPPAPCSEHGSPELTRPGRKLMATRKGVVMHILRIPLRRRAEGA